MALALWHGSFLFSSPSITIAPNMLEEMASDPDRREYIMDQIQDFFDTLDYNRSYLADRGYNMIGSGVVVHEDGTVSSWCMAVPTPEEQARVDAAMKKQAEEKRERRERNLDFLQNSEPVNIYDLQAASNASAYKNATVISGDSVAGFYDAVNKFAETRGI